MESRGGGSAADWFFLAMAHEKKGHRDEARRWWNRATAWMDENQPNNEELKQFRSEASALLSTGERAMPTGIDAFARVPEESVH